MDIAAWLKALDLERYVEAFEANDIDAAILPTLNAGDLKELGVTSLGHRKKLLDAIEALERPVRPPTATPTDSGMQASREAERRQLTVMFVDLVGSTSLSARLDPEDMQQVIRAYQSAVTAEVTRFEGHVAKYMGDGVLAYFGFPQAHEDDPERAVRAGLDITAAVGRLMANDVPLSARIGIATGLVMVGDLIGEGAAREEAVVGETPNLAARLQAIAEPGSVVIDPRCQQLVGGLFEYADIGAQDLKGFGKPVRAWRVLHESRAESRFEALHGQQLTALVGREHEIGLLEDRWERAKDGEGQVVLLSGEPGIGKSRIVRALRERLAGEPFVPLSHYCSPYHTNTALYPVIGLLERAADFTRDEAPKARLGKLEAVLARGTEALAEAVPLVAALLGIATGERYSAPTLSPQRQKQRTLEVLVDQIEGLAARQPVLTIYEDVHWVDPTTLEALGLLIERVQRLPVLVLITFRPEFSPPWTSHTHVMQLSLSRLTGRHGQALVDKVTGGKPLPGEVLDQIVAKTDGVPLFVEELTKTVLESGLLRDVGDRYELTGPLPPLAIPATLHDSLMARLDRLAPVKEVAQMASVIGREFNHDLLAAVAPLPEDRLNQALDQLVQAELVFCRGVPPAATYSFKHALVQDTAYHSLLKRRRQQLHERVAAALAQQALDAEAPDPEVLAHHYTEAGLVVEALPYWLEAGERANARFALAEAIAHLTKGLDLVESLAEAPDRAKSELALLIALGPPLMVSKGLYPPEVERLYARANDLAQQIGDQAQRFAALWGLWHLSHGKADFRTAPSLADDLVTLAEVHKDPEHLLEAHHAEWTTCFFRGKLVSASPHLAAGRALYDQKAHRSHAFLYGGHDPGTCSRVMSAMVLALRGYPKQAIAEGETALRLAHKLDNPPNLAYAEAFGAHLHQFLRDGPTLIRQTEKAMALASEQGMTPFAKISELLHGWARMECGAVHEGAAQVQRVLARARARKKPAVMMSYYLILLADAYARVGDHREGLAILAEASDMMEITDEHFWEAELHRLQGELRLREEGASRSGAERCFRQALAVAREQEARLLELRAATSLARLWVEQGRRIEAQDLLTPVYAWFTEGFDAADLREARTLLGFLR